MKKLILPLILTVSLSAVAQDKEASDPFNLQESSSKVNELGVITKSDVDQLEDDVKELFSAGKCDKAAPKLEEFARKANWLANIIASTLDPYYGASYDDRKEYPYSKLQPLIPLESLANDYKKKRNIAIAMRGECLLKQGDLETAVPVLMKALDLIELDNEAWWKRTRENLLKAIQVDANNLDS